MTKQEELDKRRADLDRRWAEHYAAWDFFMDSLPWMIGGVLVVLLLGIAYHEFIL